ncbi:hypothetical protein CFBP6109_03602 [Pseudomonas syringae pv. cerasicola]|nr:hypothetical protein CFBP6109_03602 [Pseudomonas syringae pv. cerasicola]
MTAFSTVYTLHLLAALVWVGGMFSPGWSCVQQSLQHLKALLA